jgi:hypothetical protein
VTAAVAPAGPALGAKLGAKRISKYPGGRSLRRVRESIAGRSAALAQPVLGGSSAPGERPPTPPKDGRVRRMIADTARRMLSGMARRCPTRSCITTRSACPRRASSQVLRRLPLRSTLSAAALSRAARPGTSSQRRYRSSAVEMRCGYRRSPGSGCPHLRSGRCDGRTERSLTSLGNAAPRGARRRICRTRRWWTAGG